jgi:hypothetical protein
MPKAGVILITYNLSVPTYYLTTMVTWGSNLRSCCVCILLKKSFAPGAILATISLRCSGENILYASYWPTGSPALLKIIKEQLANGHTVCWQVSVATSGLEIILMTCEDVSLISTLFKPEKYGSLHCAEAPGAMIANRTTRAIEKCRNRKILK